MGQVPHWITSAFGDCTMLVADAGIILNCDVAAPFTVTDEGLICPQVLTWSTWLRVLFCPEKLPFVALTVSVSVDAERVYEAAVTAPPPDWYASEIPGSLEQKNKKKKQKKIE